MGVVDSVLRKFSDRQGLFRNFSVLMICNIITNIIGFVINIYIARKLQPALFGLYGVVTTWVTLLTVYSSMGIQQVVIRKVAVDQDNSTYYYNLSRIARYGGALIVSLIFCIYSFYNTDLSIELLLIIIANLFFNNTFETVQNIAFGMQRMELNGYVSVLGQLILLIIYIILPASYITINNVLYILLFVMIFKYLFYLILSKKDHIFQNAEKKEVRLKAVFNLIKESLPFYILAVFTMFSSQYPVIYLATYSGNEEVAFFNTANKIMVPMSMTIGTLLSSIYPKLAQEAEISIDRLVSRFKSVSMLFIFTGCYACLSITLFRNEILLFLYGESYASAGEVVIYQSWFLVFHALFCLIGSSLAAAKHDKALANLSLFYAAVNTPLLWFFAHYGATYMSYGYIIGAVINMTYHITFLNKVCEWKMKKSFFMLFGGAITIGILTSSICALIDSFLVRCIMWLTLSLLSLATLYSAIKTKRIRI